MDKHTPGPWETAIQRWPDGTLNGTPSIYAPKAGVHPAVLSNLPEIDANARLIAAAPDLLAACKEMGTIPWVHNAAITNDIQDLRKIALAYADVWNRLMLPAIRKAEGE